MSLPPYPGYRHLNLEWLNSAPSHWNDAPLRSLFRRVKRTGYGGEVLLSVYREFGVIEKASRTDNFNNASEDLEAYQLVNPGDLAINKMKAWQGSVAISSIRGIVSPAYFIFRPTHISSPAYLHYLFRSKEYTSAYALVSKGVRVNQWDLDPEQHGSMKVLLPPLDEQRQIAEYLDRETGKIDELIAKQEQLVATLTERRQAVITEVVLRGLDSSAEPKASGLDAIGPIPAHWKLAPLKRAVSGIEQGVSPEASAELADGASWGVLKSGCVNGGTFSDIEHKRLPDDFNFQVSLAVAFGDLLVCRASGSPSLVGSAAIVRTLRYQLILSDKTFRMRPKVGIDVRFIEQFMQSTAYREQVRGAISGAVGLANNLPMSSLKSFQMAIPPLREQVEIANFLDQKVGQIDSLATRAKEVILVLRERRAALISAAVTGKIDVRGL